MRRLNPAVEVSAKSRPPQTRCRLCFVEDVALQDSHLLPAGLYRRVRGGPNHPVLVTRTFSSSTSRQVRAHLLCSTCEQRFNSCGENWTIRNCWQREGSFPLQEGLAGATPFAEGAGTRVYLASHLPHLRVPDFVYFAASVFWRAAVHKWDVGVGTPIPLGRYEEPLRRFLVEDGASFPKSMSLIMMVTASSDALACQMMSVPWLAGRSPVHKYTFDIPGVSFWLFVGQRIPPEIQRTCVGRFGILTMCPDTDEGRVKRAISMMRKLRGIQSN